MGKRIFKAFGISLLIVLSALFLELNFEGSQETSAARSSESYWSRLFTFENLKRKPQTCRLTDTEVRDGESGVFYAHASVPAGTSCDLYAIERTCRDGLLSGDKKYKHTQCQSGESFSCQVKGQVVADGESKIFYRHKKANYNESCSDFSQKRTCVRGVMTGSEDYDQTQCTSVMKDTCFYSGKSIAEGEGATFYRSPEAEYGKSCQSEFRFCLEGELSGQYEYASCRSQLPQSCHLGMTNLRHGEKKVFYREAILPYGKKCESQARSCENGVLVGDVAYNETFCRVAAPKSCQVGDEILAHGRTKSFYLYDQSPAGEACIAQKRTCRDGVISGGSAQHVYASCKPYEKQSCVLDGKLVKDGELGRFFNETMVGSGEKCESQNRRCEDGVFLGNSGYQFASCRQEATCDFAGNTIQSQASRIFYQLHERESGYECEEEERTCVDGSLSGTFINTSCYIEDRETCFFGGTSISEGDSRTFYSREIVPYGESCEAYSKPKFCLNGNVEDEMVYVYPTCEVEPKPVEANLDCSFEGQTIKNQESKLFYQSASVPYGEACAFERRICRDGVLFGSYKHSSCEARPKNSCFVGGQEIKHGQTKTLYSQTEVSDSPLCEERSQRRTCTDGLLSGDDHYDQWTCEDQAAQSCSMEDQTFMSGGSYPFYNQAIVNQQKECVPEWRTCQDGMLSGSEDYIHTTCREAQSCQVGGDVITSGASRVFYKNHGVLGYGTSCETETRTCDDGVLSGSYNNQYCYARESNMCYFLGVAIPELDYRVFYSRPSVESGESCEKYSKKKYCLAGSVDRETKYVYSSCVEK